jgi:hypothetical protein
MSNHREAGIQQGYLAIVLILIVDCLLAGEQWDNHSLIAYVIREYDISLDKLDKLAQWSRKGVRERIGETIGRL